MKKFDDQEEELQFFRMQEKFDVRYVLKDGAYKLMMAVVVGGSGLILSGVIVIAINFYLHAK